MATKDPEVIAHQQWLGYVQPVSLVVSIPAMVQAQAYVNRNIAPDHQRFLECLPDDDTSPPAITDLARFTQEVLGWESTDLVPWSADNPAHVALEVALPEYHEVLRPTHVVPEFSSHLTTDHGQLGRTWRGRDRIGSRMFRTRNAPRAISPVRPGGHVGHDQDGGGGRAVPRGAYPPAGSCLTAPRRSCGSRTGLCEQ